MTHLLVTNDFPPKIGGIQSYLFELWSRLPPDRFAVLTIDQPGAAEFDDAQDFRVRRVPVSMLRPRRAVIDEIERYAKEIEATHLVLDPVFPIGLAGSRLSLPYSLVVHGAEVRIPGHLPAARQMMQVAIRNAQVVFAAGAYPAEEIRRLMRGKAPPVVIIPPGVDTKRFKPIDTQRRAVVRAKYGVDEADVLVVSVSRLVPRKGMDVLIRAVSQIQGQVPRIRLLIGGTGRDHDRLQTIVRRLNAPVEFLGRVEEGDLPGLYGAADVTAMCCRNRWLGLEQEGFGIVFLESAAAGTPSIAGRSGGSTEAVLDHRTGLVVRRPKDVSAVSDALGELLGDRSMRWRFGELGRERAIAEFDYDVLVERLDQCLIELEAHPSL